MSEAPLSVTKLTTRLLFVRHGESNATVERRIAGMKTCSGLSPLGVAQAERLRDRYAAGGERPIDALWSSPMPRALQTATILNQLLNLEIQVDPEFEEHRPGESDGFRFDDIVERLGPPPQDLPAHAIYMPGSESSADFHYRVGRAAHRLLQSSVGQTVLISCHGGVIDVMFRAMLHLSMRGQFDLWTLNTSITEFAADHEPAVLPTRWRLVRYNDHAHLAGLPSETTPEA